MDFFYMPACWRCRQGQLFRSVRNSSEGKAEGFGDGQPFPTGEWVLRKMSEEEGVDGTKGGVESVEVNDGVPRQRGERPEVAGAEINPLRLVLSRQDRQAVGAADEGATRIEEAETVGKEGAGIAVAGCSGPFLDPGRLRCRQPGQGEGQAGSLDGEEGEVTATAVAAGSAGNLLGKRLHDVLAQGVDLLQEEVVIVKEGWLNFHGKIILV